ncbi:SRPBCC family protein [Streptomyces eurocidicus]|uniref:Acetylornithine deacetylase/succinyl-diaminopimelate desuccinylase-like protein n=1 Tax=Streptomyces eurocidicus TaxID=66423 RepID=A0A7W8BAR5_STREU|nr:SRPBCC family protein [Streptomyces eurocidicus]MBB5119947.1 acetylornithine deacetylase/succinyl-diaminopimelate desuccinylase-like protein [Streptomyces eurocidicus]
MITLSWTRQVNTAGEAGKPATTRGQLWRALLHKAEHPVGYVPAITSCRILERYGDGFLREATRGDRTLVQRVTPDETSGRITFRHTDASDLHTITNQIGEDAHGNLTLTLSITLTDAPSEAVLGQNSYLRELDTDFAVTLDAMTAVLRRNAVSASDALRH